jgi:lipopolysaccharide transport system ATP-binding protein
LFVSHNLSALRALCESAIYLEQGRVAARGRADEVIDRYLASTRARGEVPVGQRRDRGGSGRLRVTRLRVLAGEKLCAGAPPVSGGPLAVALRYEAEAGEPLARVRAALTFLDAREHRLFACDTRFVNADFGGLPRAGELVCEIPVLPLAAGRYQIDVWATVGDEVADHVRGAAHFSVSDGDFFGTGRTAIAEKNGPTLVGHAWRHAVQAPDAGA